MLPSFCLIFPHFQSDIAYMCPHCLGTSKKKMDCSLRFAIPYFAPGDLLSSATLRVTNMVRTLGNIFGFGWSKLLENVFKR